MNIRPKKNVRYQKCRHKVLEKVKKNLQGAMEFVNLADSFGRQTLLIVGSKDISSDSAIEAFKKLQAVCDLFCRKFPQSELSILPALPRPDSPENNRKASIFNKNVLELSSHRYIL